MNRMIWSIIILIGIIVCINLAQGETVCNTDGICSFPKRRPMIAGNWKMNTDLNSAVLLTSDIIKLTNDIKINDVEIALFPPFPFIRDVWKVCVFMHLFVFLYGYCIFSGSICSFENMVERDYTVAILDLFEQRPSWLLFICNTVDKY